MDCSENANECIDQDTNEVHQLNIPWSKSGDCQQSTCIQFSKYDVRILTEG